MTTGGSGRPSVLFVCVKNGGMSQMATARMRRRHGGGIDVHSAGTRSGSALDAGSENAGRSPRSPRWAQA